MEKILNGLIIAMGVFVLLVGISALMALPVMWLWNGLMIPRLMALVAISAVQKLVASQVPWELRKIPAASVLPVVQLVRSRSRVKLIAAARVK